MARILSTTSRSLSEFRLLPRFTRAEAAPPNVSLAAPLCRLPAEGPDAELMLRTPVASAAMQAVTGPEMAIALAQLGGIGVVPVSQPIDAQCHVVEQVKRYKAGFQTDLVTLSPNQSLAEVAAIIRERGYRTFPVTDTGMFHGRLLGVLTDKDFDPRSDLAHRVADRMRKDVQAGVDLDDLAEANRMMIEFGRGFLPIVSQEGTLQAVVFQKDRDRHLDHPHETVDPQRRLRVGAAVSTHPEDRERVRALLDCEVDVFVIDASDGYTAYQAEALEWIKVRTDVPVVAGNVVTAEGFDFLASRGADAIKVGMGIGSGCITQSVKATGRGQASAIEAVARARDDEADRTGTRLPLVADGGISGTAAAVVALALGADTLMLGNLLARYDESPGLALRGAHGEALKEYWMEGNRRAHNSRRYAQHSADFFEEGIEGTVPHEGSIYEGLQRFCAVLRASLATAGCADIAELHEEALLEPISSGAHVESSVHGMGEKCFVAPKWS